MIEHEIDCYLVYESYDRDVTHVAYFTTEFMAKEYISKHANKNYLGCKSFKRSYRICESIEEYQQLASKTKRAAALAKLTDEEKKLLGLV